MPAAAAVVGGGGGGAHAAVFGVDQVRQLRSVADVHRLLHEASAHERAIDGELEQLLMRRSELATRLLALHSSTEEVGAAIWAWLVVNGPVCLAGCWGGFQTSRRRN